MRRRQLNHLAVSLVALIVAISLGAGSQAVFAKPAAQGGNIVADLGFRPETNGFSFENYGSGFKDLSPAEIRQAFGDQVCGSIQDGNCILTPPAEQWMNQVNEAMSGGHCFGFAALSSLMYQGKVNASDYGGSSIVDLPIQGNENLQRALAYAWTFQKFGTVQAGALGGTPNEILDKLIEALKPGKDAPETYTIGFFNAEGNGGHAVTPYAVEDRGNGKMAVLIYDNNFPSVAREILFDTTANTWEYTASTNPNEPSSLYQGNADTKSMFLFPNSPGLQNQTECPFCENAAAKAGLARLATTPQYNEIYLDGDLQKHGHLLITDEQGHRVGFVDGKFVNEIPDVVVERNMSSDLWKDSPEPIYKVPVGMKFTLTIDGTGLEKPDLTNVEMIGPGYAIGVLGILLEPGQKDTLTLSPNGTKLSYKTDSTETPSLIIGVERSGADYEFEFKGVQIESGETVDLELNNQQNTITLGSKNSKKPATYAFVLSRIDESGEQNFEHDGITLDPGDIVQIQFGNWKGQGGSLDFSLDKGGTGKDIETVSVTDDK